MSDLKNILQEEYRKKKRLISPQSLMLMIEELLDTPTAFLIKEKTEYFFGFLCIFID